MPTYKQSMKNTYSIFRAPGYKVQYLTSVIIDRNGNTITSTTHQEKFAMAGLQNANANALLLLLNAGKEYDGPASNWWFKTADKASRRSETRAAIVEQTPNDILRAAGLTFGRQDRRANNNYRAKWGIRGVSATKLAKLTKLLEARTGVISARVEDVQDTLYNNCFGAVKGKMFLLRTSVPPTEIKLVKR